MDWTLASACLLHILSNCTQKPSPHNVIQYNQSVFGSQSLLMESCFMTCEETTIWLFANCFVLSNMFLNKCASEFHKSWIEKDIAKSHLFVQEMHFENSCQPLRHQQLIGSRQSPILSVWRGICSGDEGCDHKIRTLQILIKKSHSLLASGLSDQQEWGRDMDGCQGSLPHLKKQQVWAGCADVNILLLSPSLLIWKRKAAGGFPWKRLDGQLESTRGTQEN